MNIIKNSNRFTGFNEGYSLHTILSIILNYSISFLRFNISYFLRNFRFKICFIGSYTKILHFNKISFGSGSSLGSFVKINANTRNGIKFGKNFTLRDHSIIDCQSILKNISDSLIIGDRVGISEFCFIQVRGPVVIGSDVIIGPRTTIVSENHDFTDLDVPIREQGVSSIGVSICDNVWIGSGVTILDGVTIGSGSIIAAGAVVNKDVPCNSIMAGIPAKIIKKRS
jgi:acetyltransferase-like isoleucine patch superfamily enzyme